MSVKQDKKIPAHYDGYFDSNKLNKINENGTFSYSRRLTGLDFIFLAAMIISAVIPFLPLFFIACLLIHVFLGKKNIKVKKDVFKVTKEDYDRLNGKVELLATKSISINPINIKKTDKLTILTGNDVTNGNVMEQLDDGRVIFNRENPTYFYFQGASFTPKYTERTIQLTTGKMTDTRQTKTTKKGKAGKVVGGALVGALTLNPIGVAVGATAGALSKGKSKSKNSGSVDKHEETTTRTIQEEQLSEAIIELYDIKNKSFSEITVAAKTADFNKINKFKQTKIEGKTQQKEESDDNFVEIEKYKKLLDDGVITQSDFDTKKKQLLGL